MEATTVSESDWMQERHTALSRSRAYASKSSNAARWSTSVSLGARQQSFQAGTILASRTTTTAQRSQPLEYPLRIGCCQGQASSGDRKARFVGGISTIAAREEQAQWQTEDAKWPPDSLQAGLDQLGGASPSTTKRYRSFRRSRYKLSQPNQSWTVIFWYRAALATRWLTLAGRILRLWDLTSTQLDGGSYLWPSLSLEDWNSIRARASASSWFEHEDFSLIRLIIFCYKICLH